MLSDDTSHLLLSLFFFTCLFIHHFLSIWTCLSLCVFSCLSIRVEGFNQSPQGGWTLFHSGIAYSERRRAGVGLLVAPQLSALEFTPVKERITSLNLWAGEHALTYAPNCSTEYPAFLVSLDGGLEGAPPGGLHCSTGELQRSCGQWKCDLEGCN